MTKKLINLLASKKNSGHSDSRENLGVISGAVGIFCNIFLCITKFVLGTLTNSVSITADALNNLSDAGSSIVTIAGTKLSNKPVDKEHPFGHGRIEYISGLIVSFFIFIMGFELAKSSVDKIIHPQNIEFSFIYLIILGIAVGVKLWMAYFNNIIFKMTDNLSIKAVKQDSLNDCIATGATILALLISHFTSFKIADGVIGLIVAIIIFIQGIEVVKEIMGPLLGQAPPKEMVDDIENIMMSKEEIVGVHDLIVHNYGPGRIIASVHAEVPSDCDIIAIHEIIDEAEKEIADKLKIAICIHMDPIDINNEEVNKYKKIAEEIINDYNSEYSFHDFRLVNGKNNINLIFDLVIPHSKNTDNAKILNDLTNKFKAYDQRLNLVITIEHSYI